MKIVDYLRGIKPPKVSIIDLAVIGILALPFMSNPFHRGSYLIFYSIFIFCISLAFRPKNNYRSIPVVVLLITSLVLIFFHRPYKIVEGCIINAYFNVAIMSEGFIYILAGAMLFIAIVRYSTNTKLILFAAGLVSIIPIKYMLSVGSPVSLGFSLFISIMTYLFFNKKYHICKDVVGVSLIALFLNWSFVIHKGICRPQIWLAALKEIKKHPFLGIGFNQSVMPDGLFYVQGWNWVYVHNIFLTVWTSLGIVGLIAALWFVIDCLRHIKNTIYLIPFLFIILLCSFKETMLLPERAVICIIVMACCVRLTIKKGEDV